MGPSTSSYSEKLRGHRAAATERPRTSPRPRPDHAFAHFPARPSRAALTSSSPFSAASCSGVPPHRSCEISAPCSRSQLSTLVWPRLAAKCMAVAPSWSCSEKLTSAKLTCREGRDRGRGLHWAPSWPRLSPSRPRPLPGLSRPVVLSSPATPGLGCGPSALRHAGVSCRLGRAGADLHCTPAQGTSSLPGGPPGTPGTGAWHRCWFGHSLPCE